VRARTVGSATVLALLLALGAIGAGAAEVPIPAPPVRWVTDTVGFLTPAARAALDRHLEASARSTGTQVLVWIGETTGDTPTEDWTVRAFERWRVGQQGLDNGLVLFVFAGDRKVRVEVGYGLEGQVPDVVASRVIREVVVPRIQAGDTDGAVAAGVAALLEAVGGEAVTTPGRAAPGVDAGGRPAQGPTVGQVVLFVILGIGFVILFITNPTLAMYLLITILSGGRGGGFGGGGGFSGGGGRSGGGGATGSW
jgi:uncharacterized protein